MYYAVNPNMPQGWDVPNHEVLLDKAKARMGDQGEYVFEVWNEKYGRLDATIHLFSE